MKFDAVKSFKSLCSPAQLYLVMSSLSFLAILLQNCNDSSSYKIGSMAVKPECHNAVFFVFKALYILGFTFLLNWFCSKKLKTVSWIIVLLPFIGMFLILGAIMLGLMSSRREGFKEGVNEEDDEDNDDEDDMKEDDEDEEDEEDEEEDDDDE
jgi:RsiW-degrading membrane proteinase PrsW (M82 family)